MNENPITQPVNIYDLHYQGEYDDILCTSDNVPFTGVVYEPSSDGSVITEYEVKNGIKDGFEKNYYSEGVVEETAHYREGILHGDVTLYYPEGNQKEKSIFEYGICTEEFLWNEEGILTHHHILELKDFQKAILERRRRENSWQTTS